MRSLHTCEFRHVSSVGDGGSSGPGDLGGGGSDMPGPERLENNNGYGNGPEGGPPPGHSGDHNPQLTDWNEGPRGAR